MYIEIRISDNNKDFVGLDFHCGGCGAHAMIKGKFISPDRVKLKYKCVQCSQETVIDIQISVKTEFKGIPRETTLPEQKYKAIKANPPISKPKVEVEEVNW